MSEAALMRGFEPFDVNTAPGVVIHGARAGRGKPVLLLHGHPQTHVTWHEVAPRLIAAGYEVIATDLRGYGDSSRVPPDSRHASYSKRTMAEDQIKVMAALGHQRFAVIGHDRGGRVAHRLALDHPQAVESIAVLDISPTATMYARTDREFATRYFWWFFLIQPAPLPERLIAADPEYFLRNHLEGQSRTAGVPSEGLIQEYLRCYRIPGTIEAICEDYRAAASIDLEHDAADSNRKVTVPLLALWGAKGVVGQLYDVLETWRAKANDVTGHALDCGHALQEEQPDQTAQSLIRFLQGKS
ncbi:MAG TPA: alpha/beta hydrolase [Steroidobacteraceae bacterium]|nr:alpha/beta hydrolase [Steroidobacteraceae bacterium]